MDDKPNEVVEVGGTAMEAAVENPAVDSESAPPAAEGHGAPSCGDSPEGTAAEGDVGSPESAVSALRSELEGLRSELEASRRVAAEAHRRAILAENAGKLVPELVAGDTMEALDASLEAARAAYQSIRSATMAELAAASGAGAGNAQRGDTVDVDSMSPIQKIAHGLKRE